VTRLSGFADRISKWVENMARELIDESTYDPEALRILYQAFDEAWETMAAKYVNDPDRAEIARLKLANTILSFPVDEIKDAEQIKQSSLQLMALQYRSQSGSPIGTGTGS
jgi:hypothetical protein